MNDPYNRSVDMRALQSLLGGSLIWLLLAVVVLLGSLLAAVRFDRITGEQVGILLNKISGETEVIEQSGVKIYNGILKRLYVLDKTLQTFEMQGEQGAAKNLKIKTVDGSDVYVDVKVQFRMIRDMADVVLATSGPGELYKVKWTEHYIRALCRNYLGELTTEEFYDASKRNVKVELARNMANERLEPFGIRINSIVIPQKPRFYREYEDMIKEKKLADQQVLEERSKAMAAKQKQQTLIVEETNKNNVAIESFKGLMRQKIIAAQAEGQRIRKAADAYFDRVTIGAGAHLYEMKKTAEAILARKSAAAKGIEELKKALEGEGGRNMVKMEYARKLKDIRISGKPFLIEGKIERFEHLKGAVSEGR